MVVVEEGGRRREGGRHDSCLCDMCVVSRKIEYG
jgi:hypothetical protein